MDWNIKLTEVRQQRTIQEVLMHSTRVSIVDFIPPHFIPDVDTPDNIVKYEQQMEQSDAFVYDEGLVIPVPSQAIERYLNNIKNRVSTDKMYEGTNGELFKINYISVNNSFNTANVKLSEIEKVNGYNYARFNFII